MGNLTYTFTIMKASLDVLRRDKELLLFPLFSGICCLIATLSFAIPAFHSDFLREPPAGKAVAAQVIWFALLFAFYYTTYFIVIFFNSAIVACAIYRMRGGNPDLMTGFRAALQRLPQIAGWALVAASVGVLLRALQSRSNRIGRIAAGILGMAWSVVTFMVIPVLVVERKGPIDALRESASMLKKTWGEQLVGNFSFGLIFFILALMGLVPLIIGFMAPIMALKIIMLAFAGFYLLLLILVNSALHSIFQAAMYLYARDGRAPEGFSDDALSSAMTPR